jgi:hypothetical protein
MTDSERLELEAEIRSLRNALADTARTAERACARLVQYEPIVDLARDMTRAAMRDDENTGARMVVAIVKAVLALDTETPSDERAN